MTESIQRLCAALWQLPGRLLHPGPALRARIYLLTVTLGLLVTLTAAGFQPVSWPAGLLAALSAVSFIGLVLSLLYMIPALLHHGRTLAGRLQDSAGRAGSAYRYYRFHFADDEYARSFLYAVPGCAASLLFALCNLITGLWSRSLWYTELALYYMLLCGLRIWLQACAYRRRHTPAPNTVQDWRTYGRCGLMLILLSLVLCGMVMLVVEKGYGKTYPGFLIYAVALWTFWKISAAIRHVLRANRGGAPLLRALRHVNYTDAMVSVLTLQTAMFAAFPAGDDQFVLTLNSLTGFAVFLLTLLQGLYMLGKAHRVSAQAADRKPGDGNSPGI